MTISPSKRDQVFNIVSRGAVGYAALTFVGAGWRALRTPSDNKVQQVATGSFNLGLAALLAWTALRQ